jgi:hypothetical protein
MVRVLSGIFRGRTGYVNYNCIVIFDGALMEWKEISLDAGYELI